MNTILNNVGLATGADLNLIPTAKISIRRRLRCDIFSAPRCGFEIPVAMALFMAVIAGTPVTADTWTGAAGTTDWHTGGNWQSGTVQTVTSADAAIIDTGETVVIDGRNATSGWLEMGVDSPNAGLTITNGGFLEVYANSYVGKNAGSSGTLTVSGAGSKYRGTGYGTTYVGYSGDGTLVVTDGGTVDAPVAVARQAGSTGTVTVSGEGSSISVISSLGIGGTATLTVTDGGRVDNISDITNADITISGAGSSVAGKIGIAGGTLLVTDGGTANGSENTANFRGTATSDGQVTITGTGSSLSAQSLTVGSSHKADMRVADGATVTVKNGLTISSEAGYIVPIPGFEQFNRPPSEASMTVTGEGTTFTAGDGMRLAQGGKGTLTVSDGAVFTSGGISRFANHVDAVATINLGAAADESAIAAGSIDLGSDVRLSVGTTNIVFNHTSDDATFNAALTTGTGSATISQMSGGTTISGDSSGFFGTTNVTGGALYVTDALGGTFNVTGGTLGGTGTIGSGTTDTTVASTTTIGSGGVLAPGASGATGTLNIDGDLVFESGSKYAVHIAGNETLDLTLVGGDVTINSGAELEVYALGIQANYGVNYSGDGHVYTVVTAEGALTGDFTLSQEETAFLRYETSSDAQNAYVTVSLLGDVPDEVIPVETPEDPVDDPEEDPTEEPDEDPTEEPEDEGPFTPAANTANQHATAQALESLSQDNTLWWIMANSSDYDEARIVLDQVSGAEHASTQSALVNQSHQIRTLAVDRLRYVFEGQAQAQSALPMTVSRNAIGDQSIAQIPSVWAQAYGSWGTISAGDEAEQVDTSAKGLVLGADVQADAWRFGAMAGYGNSNFDTATSDGASGSYDLGIYAGTQWGAWSLRSGANFTNHSISRTRNVSYSNDVLTAEYDGQALQAFGELGYHFDAGNASVEPYGNLAHVRLKTDGFTESDGAAALSVQEQTMNTTFVTLGVRVASAFELGGMDIVARADIGGRHSFGDVDPQSTQSFVSGGDPFTVSGLANARNTATIEAGIDIDMSRATTFGLSYVGQHSSNSNQSSIRANFNMKF